MTNDKIKLILNELLSFSYPLEIIRAKIQKYQYDLVDIEDVVVLNRHKLKKVMDMFLSGALDAHKLRDWAELVEARDGIAYESRHEKKIADILFWLSEPDMNGTITKEKVREYIEYLWQ